MKAKRRIVRAVLFSMLIPVLSTVIDVAAFFQTIRCVDAKGALEARTVEGKDSTLPEPEKTEPREKHGMLFSGDDEEENKGDEEEEE